MSEGLISGVSPRSPVKASSPYKVYRQGWLLKSPPRSVRKVCSLTGKLISIAVRYNCHELVDWIVLSVSLTGSYCKESPTVGKMIKTFFCNFEMLPSFCYSFFRNFIGIGLCYSSKRTCWHFCTSKTKTTIWTGKRTKDFSGSMTALQ